LKNLNNRMKRMPKQDLNIIISGGGTGGHIFPAIAVADALRNLVPGANILFVGASGKMEMQKVPSAGYKIIGIPVRGLQRRITIANLAFPFRLLASMVMAWNIIRSFKPDVVAGFGGYASGPLLRMAISAGIPAVIQEQNSYPGITNKLLAKKVQKICVAYEGMERYFPAEKIVLCGNPVRTDIRNANTKKQEATEYFGLKPNTRTLLVTGGSLGARTINESIHKHIDLLIENEIQLIWQCGRAYYPFIVEQAHTYKEKGVCIREFINRMDLAYAMADLVVSRGGAIAIAELCATAKPAIIIPSPNVAEDHQTHNAMALVKKDAVLMIADATAKESLGSKVLELLNDERKLLKLSENISKSAFDNAAESIAAEVLAAVKE